MLLATRQQLRVGFGGVYGLDYGAVLQMADAMNARTPLLIDLLPEVEAILVASHHVEEPDSPDPEEGGDA